MTLNAKKTILDVAADPDTDPSVLEDIAYTRSDLFPEVYDEMELDEAAGLAMRNPSLPISALKDMMISWSEHRIYSNPTMLIALFEMTNFENLHLKSAFEAFFESPRDEVVRRNVSTLCSMIYSRPISGDHVSNASEVRDRFLVLHATIIASEDPVMLKKMITLLIDVSLMSIRYIIDLFDDDDARNTSSFSEHGWTLHTLEPLRESLQHCVLWDEIVAWAVEFENAKSFDGRFVCSSNIMALVGGSHRNTKIGTLAVFSDTVSRLLFNMVASPEIQAWFLQTLEELFPVLPDLPDVLRERQMAWPKLPWGLRAHPMSAIQIIQKCPDTTHFGASFHRGVYVHRLDGKRTPVSAEYLIDGQAKQGSFWVYPKTSSEPMKIVNVDEEKPLLVHFGEYAIEVPVGHEVEVGEGQEAILPLDDKQEFKIKEGEFEPKWPIDLSIARDKKINPCGLDKCALGGSDAILAIAGNVFLSTADFWRWAQFSWVPNLQTIASNPKCPLDLRDSIRAILP